MQHFDYQSAGFLTSATRLTECPPDEGQEIAFCGRSNAGKSSAINALTRQKKLARTSKTPGRTQLINFFTLGEQSRLVDLPGYGYAKVPMSLKQYWQTHLDEYFRGRTSLKGIVLVADIRHALKPFDEMMVTWSQSAELPIHILLTKSDKLKRGPQQSILLKLKRDLPDHASVQTFSSQNREGIDELKSALDEWFTNR